MKLVAQRLALAAFHGTHKIESTREGEWIVTDVNGREARYHEYGFSAPSDFIHPLNYLRSLDAIHEIVMSLQEPQVRSALSWLTVIIGRRRGYCSHGFAAAYAEASDWCEAVLRALGEWDEAPCAV